MTKMDFDQFPDVDNLDREVEFENGYRNLRQKLEKLFIQNESATLAQINAIAQDVLKDNPYLKDIVLATIKALMRDKVIRKTDGDTFTDYKIGPRLRSIDDAFAAYVYRPEEDTGKRLPSKKQIINDIARVARKMQGMFSMGELAKEWTKSAPKHYINAVTPVFGISAEIKSNVKRIFLSIMQRLVDEKVIRPHKWADGQYEAIPPKEERFRSLDDDWC